MAAGLIVTSGLSPITHAQPAPYPNRAITFLVPYTPGTGGDFLARVIAPKLTERWKVAVVTDNRPGASGNIGADAVAKAAPDGYTILSTATSFGTNPALNCPGCGQININVSMSMSINNMHDHDHDHETT